MRHLLNNKEKQVALDDGSRSIHPRKFMTINKEILRLPLLAITVFALGIFFRLSSLGNKLYSHDEAYTSLHAAGYTGSEAIAGIWDGRIITRDDIQVFLQASEGKGIFDTLSALARSQPHESPLFFVFSHYWMRLIGSSPAAMRGLSAFLSLFGIPGMYYLGLELFKSQKTSLLSAAFISLSPFSILFAQDARPYSLWASMTILSSAVFLTALRKNQTLVWGSYMLSLAIGFYSHQLFVLVAIAHACYFLLMGELHTESRFLRYITYSFFALVLFSPWLVQILTRWNQVVRGLDWAGTHISWLQYIQRWVLIFTSPFLDLQFTPRNIIPYLLRAPVLLLIGYALLFLIRSTPRRIWVFMLLLIGVTTFPLIFSDLLRGGILSIQGRYFVPVNMAMIPVVAHLFTEKLSLSCPKLPTRWHLFVALLLTAQIGSTFNILWAKTWWNKNLSWNNPQIVQALNQASNPLLIVYGIAPTDLGDILALGSMVDGDVRFRLYQTPAVVDLTGPFSDIYLFHQDYVKIIESGNRYKIYEVVPDILWRIAKRVD
jgi:uncharacterized membrane protein